MRWVTPFEVFGHLRERAVMVLIELRAHRLAGGAPMDVSPEAPRRWEARETLLPVADYLEQWVGPAPREDQQSQKRP